MTNTESKDVIFAEGKNYQKQIAIWVPLATKEDYEFLKAQGVKASEHCRQAIIREVARVKAEIAKRQGQAG